MLNLNDVYFTVQGEGRNAGQRALFVRLPFCDLKCSWCDTEFNSFRSWTDSEFYNFAQGEEARLAVLTGGEPTMNKNAPAVIAMLKRLNYVVAVETNGHFPIPAGIDWVCVSPKRDVMPGKSPYYVCDDAWQKASEFKYVVDAQFEFENGPLQRHNALIGRDDFVSPVLWLSPEFNAFKSNVAKILDYQRRNPWWRLNLQTHKWIEVP